MPFFFSFLKIMLLLLLFQFYLEIRVNCLSVFACWWKAGCMRMGEVIVNAEEGMEIGLETEKEIMKDEEIDGSTEVVRWERFPSRMVLRVLLVEADDSTRQLISAHLRKCSYKVVAVPDGLMAWETLKGQPHNIDLVLTELELPSISGFALLSLVMEHDICKNIPVIMMSSHDSISMVLKCMLKGAVDFLIKPVRRNELRNLWQHVWRRHCLLGGEVPQKMPVILKAEAASENDTASNYSSDYGASALKDKESCEKGNVEQDTSQLKCRTASNLIDRMMTKHDEFIKCNEESFMPENNTREKLDTSGSEDVSYSRATLRLDNGDGCDKTIPQDEGLEAENGKENFNTTSGTHCSGKVVEGHSSRAIDLIGRFDSHSRPTEAQTTLNHGMVKFEFAPQLELSLKRLNPSSSQGSNERHILNHSTASAFSWYTNGKTCKTEACDSTELKDGGSTCHKVLFTQPSGTATFMSQSCGPMSSNNQDNPTVIISNTTRCEMTYSRPPHGFIPLPSTRFDNICAGSGHVFPPVYCTQREQFSLPVSTSGHSNPDINNSCEHHRLSSKTANISENNVESLGKKTHDPSTACQSASNRMCNGLGNNDNNESSGTHGGIFCRSDGNAPLVYVDEKGRVSKSSNESTIFVDDGFKGKDSHHYSLRQAALTKFRLKRKDRCFEKKVRYLSRKNLAEQRPRVKGQFVRQVPKDSTVSIANSSP